MNAESRQPTDFEMAVYDAVRLVPAGKVTTYGKLLSGFRVGQRAQLAPPWRKIHMLPQCLAIAWCGQMGVSAAFTAKPLVPKSREKKKC
ncbi:MAG: MGMT family protein [Akkermansiaceae bacterium]|nr:MGMT family protein [Akkermansiaceae bacterium]